MRRTRRVTTKLLYSTLIALAFLLLPESLLRMLGYTGNPDREASWCREHAGFHPPFLPTMSLDGIPEAYHAPAMAAHPRPFPRRKAAHERRVFVIGSSAAHGFGFSRNGSFSGWLQAMMADAYPSWDVEVINCGAIAWSSQQHLQLAKEILADLEPDAILVYAGNNELLEWWDWRQYLPPPMHHLFVFSLTWNLRLSRWRTFVLARDLVHRAVARPWGSTSFVDDEPLPWSARARMTDRDRAFAATSYAHNLDRLIDEANARNVPVVLSTVATNWMDDPGLFPFEGHLDEGDPTFRALFDDADARLMAANDGQGDPAAAEPLFEEAFRRWPEAMVHFRWGEMYRRHGYTERATAHLLEAIRMDENPHRAQPFINDAIRRAARDRHLPLVDGEAVVRALSPDGIPGFEQIYDHCHPTVQTHVALAEAFATTLMEQVWPRSSGAPLADDAQGRVHLRRDASLADLDVPRRVDPDRVERWLGAELKDGQTAYDGDPESAAKRLWDEASRRAARLPPGPEAAIAYNHAGVLADHLFHADCDERATALPCLQDAADAFRAAIRLDPTLCDARANLGRLLLDVGRTADALDTLGQALSCNPGDLETSQLVDRVRTWAPR